jgi:hypothetical protein
MGKLTLLSLALPLLSAFAAAKECPKEGSCFKFEEGIIEAFSCPGAVYYCSGVDWKSEFKSAVVFQINSPDGDPHDSIKELVLDGEKFTDVDLTRHAIACGTSKSKIVSQLKRVGKNWKFSAKFECSSKGHAIDAVCREVPTVCTQATPN